MARKNILAVSIVALLFLSGGVTAAGESIIISLHAPDCPWAGFQLSEKLGFYLSSINRVPFIWRDLPDRADLWNFGELLSWGTEQGGRFLVDLSIDRIDLEKRKMTVIPQLIFRYRVYAVLNGTMRIIDLKKGRLVRIKDLKYETKACDQWQLIDDDETDPALKTAADEKLILFDRLEDVAASRLYKEIKDLVRSIDFGRR